MDADHALDAQRLPEPAENLVAPARRNMLHDDRRIHPIKLPIWKILAHDSVDAGRGNVTPRQLQHPITNIHAVRFACFAGDRDQLPARTAAKIERRSRAEWAQLSANRGKNHLNVI